MLRFDVGEDLLHYYCNVDRVTVYATAPVNVAVGARILRQIGAGARDGDQEPPARSVELADAGGHLRICISWQVRKCRLSFRGGHISVLLVVRRVGRRRDRPELTVVLVVGAGCKEQRVGARFGTAAQCQGPQPIDRQRFSV